MRESSGPMNDKRVIIVGGGRVGLNAARTLDEQGHSVVIIESDPDRCARLGEEYVATVIEGDGTYPDVLEQADPNSADVIAGLSGHVGSNLAACILASRENPGIRTVLRVEDESAAEAFQGVVDSVIFPERSGGIVAANAITGSEERAIEVLSIELDILEFTVAEGAPVADRTLAEVSLPRGALVLSDESGENIADSETRLVPGRTYVVAAEGQVIEEVRQLFRG
ncbi:MAG: TrkA family potassium uptake protein [Halodesulfurarchaeum sp.]